MVEEPLYFGVDQERPHRLHRQRIILHRASMRRYVEEVLWPNGAEVDYIELDVFMQSTDIFDRLKKYDQLMFFDPINEQLTRRLLEVRRERDDLPAMEFLPNPTFYLQEQEVRAFLGQKHQDVFTDFYQWQRERFNILIGDDYKPEGGQWMLSAPKGGAADTADPPGMEVFGDNQWVAEAIAYVDEHFPNNIGETEFRWPTSHQEARAWLQDFLQHRLARYGEAPGSWDGSTLGFHSGLSVSLNIGLLSAPQVVEAALEQHRKDPVPLYCLEAFIRGVLGWREIARGDYVVRHQEALGGRQQSRRHMEESWYTGSTGLVPFDDTLRKLLQHGYAQPAERQMAVGLMKLCDIDPHDAVAWFGEMCLDAAEWQVIPNVRRAYDIHQGGHYVMTSDHVRKMTGYAKGEWCDVWDGLYWRFVERNRTALARNSKTKSLVHGLDKLDSDRHRIIRYRADDFLAQHTRV